MEALRRVFASIQKYLGEMSPLHKITIILVVVVMGLMTFVVMQFTSKPEWTELMPGATPAEQQAAAAVLKDQSIKFRTTNNKLEVPPEVEWIAKGAIAEAGRLPADITTLFKNTLDRQTWYTSRQQSDQYFNLDLDNAMARLISNFGGVKIAQVHIDSPQPLGLGSQVRRPTATVAVWMRNGQLLTQQRVDAIAGLLAGAKSGLDITNIKVIDGSTGRQRRPTRDDELVATTYLEHAKRVEDQLQVKLGDMLSYIPGVTVAVTAQVDVTSMSVNSKKNLPMGEGTISVMKKEKGDKTTQADGSKAAEPGPRSNQAADISRAGGSKANKLEQETNESEFDVAVGTEEKKVVDPRGMPTSLVASVNIPQGYVVNLLKPPPKEGEKKDPTKPDVVPSDADIDAKFKVLQAMITSYIKPHLRTRVGDAVSEGEIVVSMVPGDAVANSAVGGVGGPAMSGLGLLSAGGGTIGGLSLGSGLIDKALVSVLAIAALTMMVMMVRKAGRKIELPTAEELVGVPPNMEIKSDVIGEAEEGETPMAGIEVGEEDVRKQKMLESVSDFVDKQPEGAAKLVKRWLSTNE